MATFRSSSEQAASEPATLMEALARSAAVHTQRVAERERGNGRVVMSSSAESLSNNPDVQEFYLGGGHGQKDYHAVKHYRRSKHWLT